MRICLFEDRGVYDLEPLTLTRPVFALCCGLTTLAEKQYRFFPCSSRGVLIRPPLAELYRQQMPDTAVNDLAWLRAAPVLLINGRWLPSVPRLPDLRHPCLGLVEDEIAYALVEPAHLTACAANTLEDCLATWKTALPQHQAGGRLFRHLWEIVSQNGEQIRQDWQSALVPRQDQRDLPGATVIGPQADVDVAPSARVEPMVLMDTTEGPVVIDDGALIRAFTRLEGPCYIGPGTQVNGAKIRAGTSLGPQCRIGGEIEASIVQGYSNKVHDGFLGHAYVGAWVNLGAGTQNSDLRNDYGEVRVMVHGRLLRTGQNKVGCFLGDHTKAAIGTLLNTGTNAGIFCNLLPGGLLPRYIPSFGTCTPGSLTDGVRLADLLRTAATVMSRRGVTLTETQAAFYRLIHEQTAAERRRVLREAEMQTLRRSA